MVNIKLKYNFVETPRKFIIAKFSIRKLGSSSVLIIITDEDRSLRIESFAMINLRGVFTKLYFNVQFYFPKLQLYKLNVLTTCALIKSYLYILFTCCVCLCVGCGSHLQ